jgi:hypothetical protein
MAFQAAARNLPGRRTRHPPPVAQMKRSAHDSVSHATHLVVCEPIVQNIILDRKRRRLAPLWTVESGVCIKPASSLSLPTSASAEAVAARVCSSICSCELLRSSKASPHVPGAHLEAIDTGRSMRGHRRAHRMALERLCAEAKGGVVAADCRKTLMHVRQLQRAAIGVPCCSKFLAILELGFSSRVMNT